jgi:hypothetical protein
MSLRASLFELQLEHLGGCGCGACGERPVGARVQIREPIKDGELAAQRGDVHDERA